MLEVEVSRQGNALLDLYIALYLKRYGVAPMALNATDRTILKDFAKEVGAERVGGLLEFYFTLDDDGGTPDFYVRKGHSLPLFKESIHALNAMLGLKRQSEASVSSELYVLWFSESGFPLCDKSPDKLKRLPDGTINQFIPTQMGTWMNQNLFERLQLHKIKWGEEDQGRFWYCWNYLMDPPMRCERPEFLNGLTREDLEVRYPFTPTVNRLMK